MEFDIELHRNYHEIVKIIEMTMALVHGLQVSERLLHFLDVRLQR